MGIFQARAGDFAQYPAHQNIFKKFFEKVKFSAGFYVYKDRDRRALCRFQPPLRKKGGRRLCERFSRSSFSAAARAARARRRWARRALLVACRDFLTLPDLGNSVSGNLHIVGSVLVGAGLNLGSLSIEDGTIGTVRHLQSAVDDAFGDADETDLSILYLCTHGVLSSSDDGQVYLMLGDGENEAPLGAAALQSILSGVQGEKLLIVDACYSGALIGRGAFAHSLLPGSRAQSSASLETPFLADPSIHVLTSASGLNPVGIMTAMGSPRARSPTSPARFPAASGFTASPKRM